MPDNIVPFNPNDPNQKRFLAALAQGESGGYSDPWHIGVGGTDLSNVATDQYGFPIWGGQGNSHAAGAFQFQPGTWSTYARQYGLDFNNPLDQMAGAWYDAQHVYQSKTGGSLDKALQQGDYSSIEKALASEWTSAPGRLANALTGGSGSDLSAAGAGDGGSSGTSGSSSSGLLGSIENWFQRGGLIIIGGIIIVAALWRLMAKNDIAPGPAKLAKAI